jgi:cytochrome c oxidase subunit 2
MFTSNPLSPDAGTRLAKLGRVFRRVLLVSSLLTIIVTSAPGSAAPPPFDVAQGALSASRKAADPRVIDVIARRFEFEPSVITVAVGEPVRLMVRSGDGLHGFEIKKFKVNKDIPRGGDAVIINFTPNTVGEFPIMCSEYCGDYHEDMKGMLVVQAREGSSP